MNFKARIKTVAINIAIAFFFSSIFVVIYFFTIEGKVHSYVSLINMTAVEAKEKDGKAKFVLFSTKDFDLQEINDTLYQGGIPHLVEIQEVRVLDEIPLL